MNVGDALSVCLWMSKPIYTTHAFLQLARPNFSKEHQRTSKQQINVDDALSVCLWMWKPIYIYYALPFRTLQGWMSVVRLCRAIHSSFIYSTFPIAWS